MSLPETQTKPQRHEPHTPVDVSVEEGELREIWVAVANREEGPQYMHQTFGWTECEAVDYEDGSDNVDRVQRTLVRGYPPRGCQVTGRKAP